MPVPRNAFPERPEDKHSSQNTRNKDYTEGEEAETGLEARPAGQARPVDDI